MRTDYYVFVLWICLMLMCFFYSIGAAVYFYVIAPERQKSVSALDLCESSRSDAYDRIDELEDALRASTKPDIMGALEGM